MDNQSIVFAFYKNDELIGYRQDTIGTIGKDYAKLYGCGDREQIETVLENIDYNVRHNDGFGKLLGSDMLAEREEEIHTLLQDKKAFEVRVLKAPAYIYEDNFDVEKAIWVRDRFPQYPTEQMEQWIQYPEQHEVIETHYFSMDGLMLLN